MQPDSQKHLNSLRSAISLLYEFHHSQKDSPQAKDCRDRIERNFRELHVEDKARISKLISVIEGNYHEPT